MFQSVILYVAKLFWCELEYFEKDKIKLFLILGRKKKLILDQLCDFQPC